MHFSNTPDLLPLLPFDKFSKIRDISIPLIVPNPSAPSYELSEAMIHDATCSIGEISPYRLWNDGDSRTTQFLLDLFGKTPEELKEREKVRIEVGSDENRMAFRGQRIVTAVGHALKLRTLPDHTPLLPMLKMPEVWRHMALDSNLLNGGLLIVTGANGRGKTTTASSIVATRLSTFGGSGFSVEDPRELPLQGYYQSAGGHFGKFEQIDASDYQANGDTGSGYAHALMATLRGFPVSHGGGTILFAGEIRDPETAYEVVRAATNQHLVIATLHADTPILALLNLCTLIASRHSGMTDQTARQMVATVLRGIIRQEIQWQKDASGWDAGHLTGDLFWNPEGRGSVVRSLVEGYDKFETELALQKGVFDQLNGTEKPSFIKDKIKQRA